MILSLKHGDRHDAGVALGDWLAQSVSGLVTHQHLIIPVPLHRWRFLRRKFNQSALLGLRIARQLNLQFLPDGLLRIRQTPTQNGLKREQRFENQNGAFLVSKRHRGLVSGGHVLLVDDVMTTGATLSACTEACLAAGAETVTVAVVARVAPLE